MQTTQIIEASADVVRITRLKRGDVYKRMHDTGYGGSRERELRFGVVLDVMHNGEQGAISCLELHGVYNGVEIANKVFATGDDVPIFAATPEEIRTHCDRIIEAADKKVGQAREELYKAEALRRTAVGAVDLIEGTTGTSLTAPATVTGDEARKAMAQGHEIGEDTAVAAIAQAGEQL